MINCEHIDVIGRFFKINILQRGAVAQSGFPYIFDAFGQTNGFDVFASLECAANLRRLCGNGKFISFLLLGHIEKNHAVLVEKRVVVNGIIFVVFRNRVFYKRATGKSSWADVLQRAGKIDCLDGIFLKSEFFNTEKTLVQNDLFQFDIGKSVTLNVFYTFRKNDFLTFADECVRRNGNRAGKQGNFFFISVKAYGNQSVFGFFVNNVFF